MRAVTDGLTAIQHLVLLLAEDSPAPDELVARATVCAAYRVAPEGEDVRAMWGVYGDALAAAGFAADVSIRYLDADAALGVVHALAAEPDLASVTLVAVALTDVLLLISPWSPPGWVSEEVFDHTSLMQLCERWTAAGGREVRADLSDERRLLYGDVVGALDLREPDAIGPTVAVEGRRRARPLPYLVDVELVPTGTGAVLYCSNAGPFVTRAATLAVHDGHGSRDLVVPPSPAGDPTWVTLPIRAAEGGYDVTVLGPNHFRRRFAGRLPGPRLRCRIDHFAGGPQSFPTMTVQLTNRSFEPVTVTLEQRLGERAIDSRWMTGTVPRTVPPAGTGTIRQDPWTTTYGWYDFALTTDADPDWIQEYAGHLEAGGLPSIGF